VLVKWCLQATSYEIILSIDSEVSILRKLGKEKAADCWTQSISLVLVDVDVSSLSPIF
jgi:hypothetical protein